MSDLSLDALSREILEVHAFFVEWFAGRCADDEAVLEERLLSHFADDFLYVLPGGARLSRGELAAGLRRAHGSNPDFRISVRNVTVRHTDRRSAVAFYEEWQRAAKSSLPADNGRLSTALFVVDGPRIRWAHLQETWVERAALEAERFDF
jgi:hypothetical protein